MAKTSVQILEEMIGYLSTSTNYTDVDKSEGSVLRDVVLDSVAKQLALVYTEIDSVKELVFFVQNAELISVADMDSIAKNYNLSRLLSTKATGEITFRKRNIPDSPMTIGNVDGSGGIIIATRQLSDGTTIQFVTTETVTLQTNAILNPNSNYYEVIANYEAIIAGVSGNVSAGSITNLETSVPGIDTVYNVIPSGYGNEQETNTELASRIVLAIVGNNRVNKAGYELFVKNNFVSVIDLIAVDPNNSDSVRGPGTIDIYIFGSDTRSKTDTITFHTGTNEYFFLSRPVTEVTNLFAKVGGVDTTLTLDVDYEFIKDITTNFAYSNVATDKIRFKDLAIKPDDGTDFSLSYSYNKLIGDIQEFYNLDDNRILSVDVLIKDTVLVNLNISLSVNYYSGNSTRLLELQNNIINALTSYLTRLGLGAQVSQSDIVFTARTAVPEIDNIELPFTLFRKRTDLVDVDMISLKSKEYISVDSLTFTITPI